MEDASGCPMPTCFPLFHPMDHSIASRDSAVRVSLRAEPRVWLVTGAAGFIGSTLVQELLALGQRVVGIDDFSTGSEANLRHALAGQDRADDFRFIEGDISDLSACHAACEGVDYVLHHAALASVPASIADPLRNNRVNVEGFLNMLLAARDARVRRLVYASSSAVYGDTASLPQAEERVGAVLSPYAASKAANELYASAFQQAYGLQTIGLRYFNVYGRRQDPNGAYAAVIPRWAANLLAGVRCEIYGDGETTRDFVYVADVVQANLLAATARTERAARAYNIASGAEISLNSLFSLIRETLAPTLPADACREPLYAAPRVGDIRRSRADIGRARRVLGFQPSYDAARGLREALGWYVDTSLVSSAEPVAAL
jgi:UDP-N-acetylglucosamine 4-epimerase